MSTTLSSENWKHRTAQSLALLGGLSSGGEFAPVADDFTPEDLLRLLNALCRKKAVPSVARALPPATALDRSEAPNVAPTNECLLVRLNARTPVSDFVSSQTGGVLYEDVFWALLAARNIAAQSKYCLPLAATSEELWSHSQQAAQTIQKQTFHEASYFVPVTSFYGTDAQPLFSLLKLDGTQLAKLRHDGMITTFADGGLTFFQFYSKKK